MRGKKQTQPPASDPINVRLDVGDWVDVLDGEGTWNVAQILSFPTPKAVEVRYDGWGDEYNEVLELNGGRVAPYHTYTWSVKVWAKYKNWPWWPSIMTVRPPGTEGGRQYLMGESRVFVDFLDRKDLSKRYRCWVERVQVRPFSEKFDERRKRTTGSDFETSFMLCSLSKATEKFPTFGKTGTLPAQYATAIAEPVKQMRKVIGLKPWVNNFNSNRRRHQAVYKYKSADGDDLSDDDDDDKVVEFDELSENEAKAKKSRPKSKAKAASKEPKGARPTPKPVIKKPVAKVQELKDVIVKHRGSPPEADEQPIYLPTIDDSVPDASDAASPIVIKEEPRTSVTSTSSRKRKTSQRAPSVIEIDSSPESKRTKWLNYLEKSIAQNRSAAALDEADGEDQHMDDQVDQSIEPDGEVANDAGAEGDDEEPVESPDIGEELAIVDDIEEEIEEDEVAVVSVPMDPLDDWETARSTGPHAITIVEIALPTVTPAPPSSSITPSDPTNAASGGTLEATMPSSLLTAACEPTQIVQEAATLSPAAAKTNLVVDAKAGGTVAPIGIVDGGCQPEKTRDEIPAATALDASQDEVEEADTVSAVEASTALPQDVAVMEKHSSHTQHDGKPDSPASETRIRPEDTGIKTNDEPVMQARPEEEPLPQPQVVLPLHSRADEGMRSKEAPAMGSRVAPTITSAQEVQTHDTSAGGAGNASEVRKVRHADPIASEEGVASQAPVQLEKRGSSRRSSMQAAATSQGSRQTRGRTPVWVVPPPKFQHEVDPESRAQPQVPVQESTTTAFSSLSLFETSDVPFSLDKWIRNDVFAQYLSK